MTRRKTFAAICEAERTAYPPLTADQLAAVRDFAASHGRGWKSTLRMWWLNDCAGPDLRHLRNTHGPRWLAGFKLPAE